MHVGLRKGKKWQDGGSGVSVIIVSHHYSLVLPSWPQQLDHEAWLIRGHVVQHLPSIGHPNLCERSERQS
ncbi:hypothetical protein E2C01_077214 [Portunus trituberculatus]|uniref:Uncharacterized protein n=1 Tax=Portunus trituberculatus TaxID=210409 RepID=A0A5B7IF94_PORTR|nr:hypothetical protein [Portunus trituberculatus]